MVSYPLTHLLFLHLATASSGYTFSLRIGSVLRTSRLGAFDFSRHTILAMSSASSPNGSAASGLSNIGKKGDNQPARSDDDSFSWRDRITGSIARSRKIRGGNFVQIATVDPDSLEPRCRTVVFRGFLPHRPSESGKSAQSLPTVMKMITDLRSSKVAEATNHPKSNQSAELVWWFVKSSEQYRIRGKLQFVGCGSFEGDSDAFLTQMRKEQWGNLSDSAREQFYWKDPSVPYTLQNDVPAGGRGEDGKVLPPPKNFLLMLLHPTRVDYLRLGDNYRQIDNLDGEEWRCERVNP